MAAAAAAADDPRTPDERGRREEDESEEEIEVESGDEDEGDGDGYEVASLMDLCDPDAGSDEDPTFDPDADRDLEVEAVLRSRMSRMSISASARTGRKGSAVPEMGKEDIDLLAMVDKLIKDGQLEKLKVYECRSYLRMHKLRLTGNKEVLLNRIREHTEVKNDGEVKYPVSSFVLNCKGDACKGDIVMFEQNIYRRKKGAPCEVKHLCGQRTNADRIIKESYGTGKQQHTFTIEILWSKGYKPWPPLHPLLIKGRNLYKDKTLRQPWVDEEERNRVLQEKHARGFQACKSRASRVQKKEIEKKMRFNMIKDNKSKEQQDMNQKPYNKVVQQVMVERMTTIYPRTDENKCPSIHNGGPGNTRHGHCLPLKATTTHHNEVLPQKGATGTFKQEFINHQIPSIQHGGWQKQHLPLKAGTFKQPSELLPQMGAAETFKQEFINHQIPSTQHGGLQQQMHPQPTHTQQMFKNQHQQPNYHNQNEVWLQEGAMMTSRKESIDRQAPSQQTGGSGNTRQHEISLKLTLLRKSTPKHQDHNDVKTSNRGDAYHYQNKCYQTAGGVLAYHPRGNFTHQTKAHQHGSNSHQNGPADHQVHQPLRSRNWNIDSSDQYYCQNYNNQYNHGYRRMTPGKYHPQLNRHQNNSNGWNRSQDQYQNYVDNGRTRMNQKQYHHQQNQSQQRPVQPSQLKNTCYFFYENGWCGYGENCRYSHDFYY